MALFKQSRKRVPTDDDPGLQEIRAWHDWFVGAHQRRLAELGLPPDQYDGELEAIIALAASIRERMTSDYLVRTR
jgi:hypothetical protein